MLGDRPGTYALLLYAETEFAAEIGRLGRLIGRPGWYVYVGSAFGPGGVRARVGRHLRLNRRSAGSQTLRWHVDYLHQHGRIREIWVSYDETRLEHIWAAALAAAPPAEIPLPRLGASDCRCPSHLFFFASRPKETWIGSEIKILPLD